MIPNKIAFVYDRARLEHGLNSNYNLKNVDVDMQNHKNYGPPQGRFRNATHMLRDNFCQNRDSKDLTFKTAKKQGRFIIYDIGLVEGPPVWLEDTSNITNRNNKKNIFDLINDNNPKLYSVLRKKDGIIILDQSMEGFPLSSEITSYAHSYQQDYYTIIHDKLSYYKINPSSIHYVTSNLYEPKIYNKWCSDNNITDKIVIHSYNFFAKAAQHYSFFQENSEDSASITVDEHLKFKTANNIKTFSNLNRVIRTHRIGLLYMLNYYNLLDNSHTSFANFDKSHRVPYSKHAAWTQGNIKNTRKKLPLTLDVTDFNVNQAQNFFKETYLNTWYSVITETFFQDYFKYSMFFSEKIFKPMRARHPFVLVGQPYALDELKKIGFKTFNEFWDESYDVCRNPTDRLEKICELIAQLNKLSKKEWIDLYKRMEPVLEHNYNHLMFTDWTMDRVINV
jgi:hypothetical protein